jgi:eukaryotic-like serine/threonine-protein kinase
MIRRCGVSAVGVPSLGDSLSSPHELDLPTGTCIAGRYRIERLLGTGGMGAVYAAFDLRRNERVAVKVLGIEPSSDVGRLERFRREARAVTQIGHPNIVRALDAGMIDPHTGERMAGTMSGNGRGFLVMELLEGDDLHARLRRESRLPTAVGVAIARQVAAGLAAAHAHGIVHRDLKPENVFLCRDGVVKVLDFGLAQVDRTAGAARVTAQNALLGTPEYMSPEQAAGNPVDARADVYALGCMLYEMFTGRPPFTGRSFVAVLMAQLAEAPVPPRACDPPARIPAPLEALILKALAKEADQRQPTMRALEAELADVDLDAAPAPAIAAAAAGGPLVLAEVEPEFEPEEGPTTIYSGRGPAALPSARARVASGPRPALSETAGHGGSPSLPAAASPPARLTTRPLPRAAVGPARPTTGSRPPAVPEPARRITAALPGAAVGPARPATAPLPATAAGPARRITAPLHRTASGSARRTTDPLPGLADAEGMSPELALMTGQGLSDDAHTAPVPKLPGGPTSRQRAAWPDPLPRILDQIDPPERHRLGAATLVVAALLLGALVAGFVWLLVR